MKRPSAWPVRLSGTAAEDYRRILRWTAREFGVRQARMYAVTLDVALLALTEGPQVVGARPRPEIGRALMTLHVQRAGRRGRHFVLFRTGQQHGQPCIDVLRLLHDAMDLPRHAPETDDAG